MYLLNNRLGLRTWQKGDEPYLAQSANNFNIWKFVMDSFPHPYTFDDARFWIDLNLTIEPATNFAIIYDGEPIGNIGIILGSDIHKNSATIGYWISENHWGTGIATLSTQWIVEYAFRTFEINRLWAGVFSNNPASMRVLIKAGFKEEAFLKKAVYKNRENLDEYIFSIVR